MGSAFEQQKFSAWDSIPEHETQRVPLTRLERYTKRACDVTLAAIALFLLAPVLLASATAIKLIGGGPIIVLQRRKGFNGRVFFAYKFRSAPANDMGAHLGRGPSDSTATSLGSLLRQSNIDELPQLINVLKGDMSLVGPRLDDNPREKRADLAGYAARLHFKPGMTGWSDVNGRRREPETIEQLQKRLKLDLWYINNWSLTLDLKILWRICFARTDANIPKS